MVGGTMAIVAYYKANMSEDSMKYIFNIPIGLFSIFYLVKYKFSAKVL